MRGDKRTVRKLRALEQRDGMIISFPFFTSRHLSSHHQPFTLLSLYLFFDESANN